MKDSNNIEIETTTKRKDKFFTKDKICFFVIGVLLGAIIASSAFLIYSNINGNSNSAMGPGNGTPPNMSDGGTPPELPNGEMPDGETPPELPEGEEGTPPELPDGETPSENNTNQENSNEGSENSSTSKSDNARSKKPSGKPSKTNSTNAS